MQELKIEYIQIEKLIPYVNNPRHNDKAVDVVAGSIAEFGFKNPIIVDVDNVIIAGHTRLLAARKLGYDKVPIIKAEDLTDQQVKAFRIADNKTAEFAEWDIEALKLELGDLEDMFTGFSALEIEDMFLAEIDAEAEDFKEDLVEYKVNKGDLWSLGPHRLLCGDSFNREDLKILLQDSKPDLVIMDPPFDLEDDSWIEGLGLVKKGCPMFLLASDKQTVRLANKIPNFRHFLVHDRVSAVMLNSNMPMSRHTIISFFCKEPGRYFRNLKDYFTTIIELNRNYKDTENNEGSKMGKPVGIPKKLIEHYSKEEDIILSLFGGGGSDLIAAEMTNRVCFVNEIEPKQCSIILSRWEQYTGNKGVLVP